VFFQALSPATPTATTGSKPKSTTRLFAELETKPSGGRQNNPTDKFFQGSSFLFKFDAADLNRRSPTYRRSTAPRNSMVFNAWFADLGRCDAFVPRFPGERFALLGDERRPDVALG
jgi:hypothetical protein